MDNHLICHKNCRIKARFAHLSVLNPWQCTFIPCFYQNHCLTYFAPLYLESDSSSFSLNCLPRLLLQPADCSSCLSSCPFPIHYPQSCQLLSVSHQHQHYYYLFCITLTGLCASLLHYIESFWVKRTVFYLTLSLQHPVLGLMQSKTSINEYGKKENRIPI